MAGQFDLDQAETLENAVFQAIGAASVCWETPEGAGVFNSDRAKAIGEELMAEIKRRQGLDRESVDRALRQVISHADYDLHKSIERDEETEQDNYGEYVDKFVATYNESAV